MSESIYHPDGHAENPTVRHERSDVNVGWIVGLLVAAGVFGLFLHFIVLLFFFHSKGELELARKSQFPLAPSPSQDLPAPPRIEQLNRLEGIRSSDVSRRQEVRLEQLRRYGATEEKGFVRIPIDEAMKHLANRLPARKLESEQPPRDNGLVGGGDPNSGRLFNRRKPSWFGR